MGTEPQERSYDPAASVVFQKTTEEWGELSNMAAGFPVVVAGEEWLTVEAVYQACRFPHMPEVQQLILAQRSPMAAKMKSKPFRAETRSDWETVRTRLMRWVLHVKLAQNFARFSSVLRRTGDRPIVERSHKDRFWGTVMDPDGTLSGVNALGRLLMELRGEVLVRDSSELLTVDPPQVAELRLIGKIVGRVSWDDQPTHPKRFL